MDNDRITGIAEEVVVSMEYATGKLIGSDKKRRLLIGLMAAVAMGAVTAIGSTAPSMAQVASAKFDSGQSLIDKTAWQGHRGFGGGRAGAGGIGVGRFGGFRGGYAGRGYGRGRGGGVAAGIAGVAAGAIVGGALAGQAYPGYDYRGYGYQDAPDPGYAYVQPAPAYAGGGSAAYCESQFRSYNPATGIYLGFDGLEHPCP
ncbi:BA14K-like protein [Rhizobiales bacterium GAS191]|nr:BA14K-like protein [Rhizobiales bacterium GAS191]